MNKNLLFLLMGMAIMGAIASIVAVVLFMPNSGQTGFATQTFQQDNANTEPEETCTPDWECNSWSECSVLGKQTRVCNDLNHCETSAGKPETTKTCTFVCTPNWQCGEWEECTANNDYQQRDCIDVNNCEIYGGDQPTEGRPCPVITPNPVSLSGTGQTATQFFRLEKGLSKFMFTHNGQRNFIVHLTDSYGNDVEYLTNEIGHYDGSIAMYVALAGNYLLNVNADGDWTAYIEQPRPTSAGRTSVFNGIGPKATDFFQLDNGLVRFKLTHSGGSNFIVHLNDKEGHKIGSSLTNEIGLYDGSVAVQVERLGIYFLSIDADGVWSIIIE